MARAGLLALEYWDPTYKKWGQGHMQYVLFSPEFYPPLTIIQGALLDLENNALRGPLLHHPPFHAP
jgi:hypothetical protein